MTDYITRLLEGESVEWRTLGEVAEISTGSSNRQDETPGGQYPFYVRSQQVLRSSSYQFDETAIIIPGEGGVGDIFHFATGRYSLHQRAYRIHITENALLDKFVYYYLTAQFKEYISFKSVGATATSIRKPMLEAFRIPVPPMRVQRRIVEVLDAFSALTAELEAELEGRRRQYAHYREQLLALPDAPRLPLGEVADYVKTRISNQNLTAENYVGVENLRPNCAGKELSSYVPTEGTSVSYQSEDILLGNIRPYLKKIWFADGLGGASNDVLVIRTAKPSLSPRYLYHVLASSEFFHYNMQHAKGAKMPRGNKEAIMNYPIPIPPLEEQRRIVEILDRFSTLCESITEGLPREIELRRKQYEYYREQLLTFR